MKMKKKIVRTVSLQKKRICEINDGNFEIIQIKKTRVKKD